MEVITVRGVEYRFAKARDFEVIVRSDNGFINYTKLCQQINGGKKPFYNIKANETFKRLSIQMEISSTGIPGEQPEIGLYEEIEKHIEIVVGGRKQDPEIAKVAGTYMPRYLLDYVIMTCDISYYKLIHELVDSIDLVAQKKNKEFHKELEEIIEVQNMKLRKRKEKIDTLESKVDRLLEDNKRTHQELINANNKLDVTNQELINANNKLDVTNQELINANNKLETITTTVTQVAENLQQTSQFIDTNFNEKNLTLGHTKEVLAIFSIQSFTDFQHPPDGKSVYDIFAGQPKFMRATMMKRKYKPTEEEFTHPIVVIEASDAKDLLNYVRDNVNEYLAFINSESKLVTVDIQQTIRFIRACRDTISNAHKIVAVRNLNDMSTILVDSVRAEVNRINRRLDSIESNQNRIMELLLEKKPNADSVLVNGRYRKLEYLDDGRVIYAPRANSDKVNLTANDIDTLRFKDNDGKIIH